MVGSENSFGAKRLNRIDQSGPARGQQAGEKRHRAQDQAHHDHRAQISRADPEEKALQQTSAGENAKQAEYDARTDETHALQNDKAQNVVTLRAKRETNSDFLRSLRHRVTHHTENSGGG